MACLWPPNYTKKRCVNWGLNPFCNIGEKESDLTRSYDKCPYANRKFKTPSDNTKTQPKTPITQLLRTDLGWSVRVGTDNQLRSQA